MTKRAAAYAGVSTDLQAERHTIDAQLHAIRQYAQQHGVELVVEIRDEGVSGTVPFEERPGGAKLLECGREGLIDAVIFYTADRLGRDVVEARLAVRKLQRLGLELMCVTQTFDGSPENEFAFTALLAAAELDRKLIVRRTTVGRRRSARAGKYMASIPRYGYRKDEEGRIAIVPEEAAVVRQVFEWTVGENLGLVAIANRLNARGVPPPHNAKSPKKQADRWLPTTISKMLRAVCYTGQGKYGPEAFTYPAIVDPELFHAAQAALARRQRANIGDAKAGYWLSGLVFCRRCGVRAQGAKLGRARRRAYRCGGWHRGRRQGHGRYYWWADEVEAAVRKQMEKLMWEPEKVESRLKAWLEEEVSDLQAKAAQEREMRERQERLKVEEHRVLALYRKGLIDDDALARQMEDVSRERASLEDQLRALDEERKRAAQDIAEASFKMELLRRLRHEGLRALRGIFRSEAILSPAADPLLDEVDNPDPDDEHPTIWRRTADPARWRAVLETLGRVYLEPDGSVTIEGTIPAGRADTVYPPS